MIDLLKLYMKLIVTREKHNFSKMIKSIKIKILIELHIYIIKWKLFYSKKMSNQRYHQFIKISKYNVFNSAGIIQNFFQILKNDWERKIDE